MAVRGGAGKGGRGGTGRGGRFTPRTNSKGKEADSHSFISAKEASASFFMCSRCEIGVREGDPSIMCHDCKEWFHKECTPLSDEDFDYLCMKETTKMGVEWICSTCKAGKGPKRGEVEAHLERLVRLFESVDARLKSLESGCSGEALEKKIEDVVSKKVAEIWDEKVEKDKRQLNLIIANIPESNKVTNEEKKENDIQVIKSVVSKICPDLGEVQLEEPVRLGRENAGTRPRLLRVQVRSTEIKGEILRNARKINQGVQEQKNRIYINADYTPMERQKNKELRDELKRRVDGGERDIGIRGGMITSVKWSPRPGLDGQEA